MAWPDWKWGSIILGVGLLVAVPWTLVANFYWTGGALVGPEASEFIALARSLLAGEGYLLQGVPTSSHAPGYPLFFAGVFALLGHSILHVGLVQSALHAGSALIFFFLGRRLYGQRVGVLAGFIAALYPFYVFNVPFPLAGPLGVLLVTLTLFFIYRASQGHFRDFLWAGLAFGGTLLSHVSSLGLLPLMLLYLLWRGRRKLMLNVGGCAVLVMIVALVLTPWVIHNWKIQGKLLLGNARLGQGLWIGTNPRAGDYVGGYIDSRNIAPLPQAIPPNISEAERDNYHYRAFIEYVREHPSRFFTLWPHKLVNMWRPTWEGSSVKNWVVLGVPYIVLILLALVGFSRARQNSEGSALLFMTLAYWVFLNLVFYGIIQDRVKAMTPVILFAALGLDTLWRWRSPARRP